MASKKYDFSSDSETFLARFPIFGFVLFLIGISVFILLMINVRSNGPLVHYDETIIQAIHHWALQHPNWLYQIMRGASAMGREVIAAAFVVLLVYFAWKKRWKEFGMLAIGVGAADLWFEGLSMAIDRHRPVLAQPFETLSGPGFPSGHTISAVCFYGLLLYLLLPRLPSRGWRIAASALTLIIILSIGIGRLYVGLHYPSDVLAGYAFGLAWGALVYTLIEIYFQHLPLSSPILREAKQ